MNIENLEVGKLYKNYKELCDTLGIEPKTSNSKNAQLKELERYVDYDKQGHKFIIKEIYKEPITLIKGNNTLPFIDEMEILLLNLLLKSKDNKFTISNSRLLLELCMINPNYTKFFNKKKKLSEILNMKYEHVIDFSETTNSTLKGAINSAIKRLVDRKLIIHEQVMMVNVIEPDVEITQNGYAKATDLYYYDSVSKKYKNKTLKLKNTTREATEKEREEIISIESRILTKEFKCENVQQVFGNGSFYNYYKRVSEELFNELNIKLHYIAHRFTLNQDAIKERSITYLGEIEEVEKQKQLNLKVIERLNYNANRRHDKAKNKTEEDKGRMDFHRVDDDYTSNIAVLNNTLMNFYKYEPLNENDDSEEIIITNDAIDQYVLDSLPENM